MIRRKQNKTHAWNFFAKPQGEPETILQKIQAIGDCAIEQKNWEQTAQNCEAFLCSIADYLKANDFQTAFFTAVFYSIYFAGKETADFASIQEFFNAKQIMLIQRKKEILEMAKLGILIISQSGRRIRRFGPYDDDDENTQAFCEKSFSIPDAVTDAIVAQKALPKERVVKTPKDFLEKLNKTTKGKSIRNDDELYREVRLLEEKCVRNVSTLENVCKKIPDFDLRFLFYFICYDSITARRECCDLSERISQIVEDSYDQNALLKELISDDEEGENQNPLLELNLIEINEARMAEDSSANTTNEGFDLMFGKDAALYKTKIQNKELIQPDKIQKRELFFSGQTSEQLARINSSLEKEKFNSIKERLKEKGMSEGIAALFYGPPGTGKTESAQQLARETGRAIYHVDISQTKTMWYGESPKLVKKIFKKYKGFCDDAKKEGKEIPILLFNEADAVISKRKDVTGDTSECDKESNSIQNVVLEEMEKLEGIMIATTNLADNMDSAFERRFLFKVEFQKPDAEGRAKIWRSKLKSLEESDALAIAKDYDFSGGEIDNVSRKVELEEVISGKKPNLDKIREFCQTEKIHSENARTIGFGA